jgi:phage terminase large subunit
MTNVQTATDKAVENFKFQAENAGVPRGTLRRFWNADYVPQPKQLQFHAKARLADFEGQPNEIGLGGARGGGKTAGVFAQIAIDDCQRFENLKVLFLRQSAGSATESINDLRLKFLRTVEHKPTRNILTYPNDSRIILGHFQYEKDINKYLGLEYDVICLEEATQLSYTKLKDIRTCLRSSKGFRPRMYLTTNPGGIGHAWFKQEFILPHRLEKETDRAFIFALESDNKYNNKEYRKTLDQLTGWKRKAWLEGDWDILAGQFFENFRYDKHVIKPREIPKNARFWGAFDYGFNHPTVFLLLAQYDGKIYVMAEYWQRKKLPKTNADEIKKIITRFGLNHKTLQIFAGVDVFADKGDENGKTIDKQYKEQGINFTAANTDRINGAAKLLQLLGDEDHGIEENLYVFNTCPHLIEQIPNMQHDPNRPDDVLKVDIDEDGGGGDDCYDTLRYGIMAKHLEWKISHRSIYGQ